MTSNEKVFLKKRIRVPKEETVFLYALLESYEGLASYSTVDFSTATSYRDMELRYSVNFKKDVERLLGQLGSIVYVLEDEVR